MLKVLRQRWSSKNPGQHGFSSPLLFVTAADIKCQNRALIALNSSAHYLYAFRLKSLNSWLIQLKIDIMKGYALKTHSIRIFFSFWTSFFFRLKSRKIREAFALDPYIAGACVQLRPTYVKLFNLQLTTVKWLPKPSYCTLHITSLK